jgi:hypothetical protein
VEPWACDEALHQHVPSNVVFLLQCSLDVFMVPGRELVVENYYGLTGKLEVLINASRDADSVLVFVSADLCFHKENDCVFASWRIPCAV